MYRRTQVPVKVIRGRGCNESFRAAVDRSYEAPHHAMEPGKNFTYNCAGTCVITEESSKLSV